MTLLSAGPSTQPSTPRPPSNPLDVDVSFQCNNKHFNQNFMFLSCGKFLSVEAPFHCNHQFDNMSLYLNQNEMLKHHLDILIKIQYLIQGDPKRL